MALCPKVIGLAPSHWRISSWRSTIETRHEITLCSWLTLMLPLTMKATPPNIFLCSAFAPAFSASAMRCSEERVVGHGASVRRQTSSAFSLVARGVLGGRVRQLCQNSW